MQPNRPFTHLIFKPFSVLAKLALIPGLLFTLSFGGLNAQPIHSYYFDNTLAGTGGGPVLTQSLACGAGSGTFSVETIATANGPCVVDTAFCFNDGGGLVYNNPSYITNQYTIHVFFKFTTIGGWSRIIDFSNSAADAGIYWLGNCLNFYPNGNVGTCPYFVANLWYLMSFVRDGSTGVISCYVNGALFGTYNDSGTNLYRCATSTTPITFFRDDNVVTCEAQPGCVKYISITSQIQTAAQVASTWTNICTIVLPVELASFNTTCVEGAVKLNWSTSSEINNHYFIIEKSSDAVNWSELGRLNGHGNSNEPNYYEIEDLHPYLTTYYRLQQVDYNGTSKYFDNISPVTCNDKNNSGEEFGIYPNPANGEIFITCNYHGQLELWNLLGEKIFTFVVTPGKTQLQLSYLKSGAYILKSATHTEKLIIQ